MPPTAQQESEQWKFFTLFYELSLASDDHFHKIRDEMFTFRVANAHLITEGLIKDVRTMETRSRWEGETEVADGLLEVIKELEETPDSPYHEQKTHGKRWFRTRKTM